jgi:ElaB/YqjD/DUF883 family membrane-anchored ribosome-binding protein
MVNPTTLDDTAGRTAGSAAKSGSKVVADAKSLAERAGETVERLARDIGTAAGDHAEAALAAAREAKASASEALDSFTLTARERVDEGIRNLSQSVSDHPLRSIAVAAGIGLLVGMLTRPERR